MAQGRAWQGRSGSPLQRLSTAARPLCAPFFRRKPISEPHACEGRRKRYGPVQAVSEASLSDSGNLAKEDMAKFVRFMHLASPYVQGHRGRTFVIAVPGDVVARKDRLHLFLDDIALLHGLGVRLVLVCGAKPQIDDYIRAHGEQPRVVGAYRVTDTLAMQGALQAAGTTCTEVSAYLSKAPSIPMVRRHARGDKMHFAPTVQIVNGNYVTAKRRGIVNGVDFGLMGQVRYIQRGPVMEQLQAGNIVLLTNVGVSAAGELLNCNAYDVATHAAVELKADKLLCLTAEDVRALKLPHYLPLDDAEQLITSSVCEEDSQGCANYWLEAMNHGMSFHAALSQARAANGSSRSGSGSSLDSSGSGSDGGESGVGSRDMAITSNGNGNGSSSNGNSGGGSGGNGSGRGGGGRGRSTSGSSGSGSLSVELNLDLDSWQQIGFPNAVLAAVVACKNGVKRAHLIDADKDGAMLLELYTRDGITGVCMIAADLYEGIRPAQLGDQSEVSSLLAVMREGGYDLPFPLTDLANRMDRVTVLEREGKVLGCACYADLGTAPDGIRVGEITAIIVHPGYRRAGFGDALLDFVEQQLRGLGIRRIALVVDAGSMEFFTQRDFELVGPASSSELLPPERRGALPDAALAQLYVKPIVELDASVDAPAGKRVGF